MDSLSSMKVFTDLKFLLSVDDILRGQGADPQIVHNRKPMLVKAAENARSEGVNLLHPVALTQEVVVTAHRHERILLEGGKSLTGPLLTRQLGGAQRVVAAVCTIGSELEETVGRLLSEDPLYALALDGLGNAAVENLAQQVCAGIEAEISSEGLQASTPLSPGSPDWPVEIGQPQIFALVDPSKARIRLTSAGMMLPKKSISFMVGIGPEMSHTDPCEVCSLKETCRYGHA
jgi:hypothetical protein